MEMAMELDMTSSCLVRWGRELEGMGILSSNLCDSEARIKVMCGEVSLQQPGYCLHTMILHKGRYLA